MRASIARGRPRNLDDERELALREPDAQRLAVRELDAIVLDPVGEREPALGHLGQHFETARARDLTVVERHLRMYGRERLAHEPRPSILLGRRQLLGEVALPRNRERPS